MLKIETYGDGIKIIKLKNSWFCGSFTMSDKSICMLCQQYRKMHDMEYKTPYEIRDEFKKCQVGHFRKWS